MFISAELQAITLLVLQNFASENVFCVAKSIYSFSYEMSRDEMCLFVWSWGGGMNLNLTWGDRTIEARHICIELMLLDYFS